MQKPRKAHSPIPKRNALREKTTANMMSSLKIASKSGVMLRSPRMGETTSMKGSSSQTYNAVEIVEVSQ